MELPCMPGSTVYSVGPFLMLSEDIGLPIKSELKIFEEIYSLEDILLYLKEFGITKFTTLEEAEKYKEEMERK